MVQRIIFILSILFPLAGFSAVQPPELSCISVLPNGDVTLTWNIPSDPSGEFQNYFIYHADNSNGPFSVVATVNMYTQTSYTYSGANLTKNKDYFFMKTKYDDGTGSQNSGNSDTLRPILVSL